ncbi:MAG: phosphohydrolase, partial [Sulfuricella sp.]
DLLERLEKLNAIGVALSAERDTERTLEAILEAAKSLTNADGGTLYRVTEDNHLKFEILRNDTLNIAMGGTTGAPILFDPLPLFDARGKPNNSMVVAYSVLHDATINIEDAYTAEGFDFSG